MRAWIARCAARKPYTKARRETMRELKRPPRLATQKSRTGVFSLPSDARKRVKINRAFFCTNTSATFTNDTN